jgi:hypothetical protein
MGHDEPMSLDTLSAPGSRSVETVAKAPVRRWPALAAATYIAVFCLVAGAAVVWSVAHGASWNDNGVVLLAIFLRMLTVAFALASVQRWGARVPS